MPEVQPLPEPAQASAQVAGPSEPHEAVELAWSLRHRDAVRSARLAEALRAAVEESPEPDLELLARAQVVQASHAFLQQDHAGALRLAQEALPVTPYGTWLGRLMLVLGNVSAEIGEPVQAAGFFAEAIQVGRRVGDDQLVAQVLLNATLDAVDVVDRVRDVERALRAFVRVDDDEGQAYARLHLAQMLADERRHQEAVVEARRAVSAATRAGSTDVLAHALTLDALVSARLGHQVRAEALLAQVAEIVGQARPQLEVDLAIEVAGVRATLGQHDRLVGLLEPYAGSAALTGRQAIALTDLLAEGYAALGDHESAYWALRSHVETRDTHEDDTARRRAAALVVLHRAREVESEARRARRAQEQLEAEVDELRTASLVAMENSLRDELTGLHNRRLLNQRLLTDVPAARPDRPVSLLLLDLDHFKEVNDTHGHVVGDQVLHELGRLLRTGVRSTDVAARYGGEELAVLQPGTDLAAATALAERLRRQVGEVDWLQEVGAPVALTVSVGVACTTGGENPSDLVRRADEALYAAKAAGRDRVVAQTSVG